MMTELTLFTTLAFHHLTIGGLLSLGLLLTLKLVPSSAELRSWLWMTVFVLVTLVPFSLLSFNESAAVTNSASSQGASQVLAISGTQVIDARPNTGPIKFPLAEQGWHLSSAVVFMLSPLLQGFLVIWLLGSVWRGYHFCVSLVRTWRLLGRSKMGLAAHLQAEINDKHIALDTRLNAFAVPRISLCQGVSSPLVTGLWSPKIIIPLSLARQLSVEQLIPIVLHEQAHIQRKDIWCGLFQEVIAILFWWSPVIRFLNKKIHIDRELACDIRAAKQLTGKQYAQSLLDCAKLMIQEQRSVLTMGLFSKKKELVYRVDQVLQKNAFTQVNKFWVTALCLGLSVGSIQAATSLSPKIIVSEARADGKQYSLLPQTQGQRLVDAVLNNDIATIKTMQNAGVDLDIPAIGDGTALMVAVQKHNLTMVQALLSLGVNVDQPSIGDGNPLIVAAMVNDLEIAKVLLDAGADVNAIVHHDETALINASYRGFMEMTRLLVERGADVNLAVKTGPGDGGEIRSPLNRARNQQIKDYLISQGASQDGVLARR
ncbi:peptidase M56, BlaR1 [Shewanella denitrificans OS217]|jgi:bla regulator protein blaR1|uniref:Peptidase M56, BlaR1 n=1 Tax=Shewanella denitrificans (strain OS217 / ATCC BAA-1090 / DSM 15013) TaxID=318161 RepID=Q12RQ7_SHEDO|nr:M56 family metallopeptidase [Shewanella denitrificans]ABE53869.1 peptidase M56, BlaR1 [Shewanella denitrificans OS217]